MAIENYMVQRLHAEVVTCLDNWMDVQMSVSISAATKATYWERFKLASDALHNYLTETK